MNAAPRPLRVRAIVVAAVAIALAHAARGDDAPAPAPAPAPVTVERTLALEDGPRSFRLHLPSAAPLARPVPLVVCIHGLGGSGRIQEALTGMDAAADARSFAVAYPDGRARMWAFEAPLARPGAEAAEPNRDVRFIGAL